MGTSYSSGGTCAEEYVAIGKFLVRNIHGNRESINIGLVSI